MLNIAIVNDSAIAIEALRRAILTTPDYHLLWIAQTGAEAIQQATQQTPDLILMDMHMPNLDGVEATRQIMQHAPCAILIVTASISRHSSMVFQAMSHGALDVVKTPAIGTGNPEAVAFLLKKVATLAKYTQYKSPQSKQKKSPAKRQPHREQASAALPRMHLHRSLRQPKPTTPLTQSWATEPMPTKKPVPQSPMREDWEEQAPLPPLIVIGASTGGPGALKTILSQLPKSFRAAIIVIQHIDQQFAPNLAEWLNQFSTLPVTLARNGDRPEAGKVLVAAGGQHLWMRPNQCLRYTQQPNDCPYRPSVDVFFNSVAQHWQQPGIALLLTGMGKDGAEGLKHLRLEKWRTIAESQASCVVFGMPKAAINLGAAQQTLSLAHIPAQLVQAIG